MCVAMVERVQLRVGVVASDAQAVLVTAVAAKVCLASRAARTYTAGPATWDGHQRCLAARQMRPARGNQGPGSDRTPTLGVGAACPSRREERIHVRTDRRSSFPTSPGMPGASEVSTTAAPHPETGEQQRCHGRLDQAKWEHFGFNKWVHLCEACQQRDYSGLVPAGHFYFCDTCRLWSKANRASP